MKSEKLYTRKDICEIVAASYNQVNYAIQALGIKPIDKFQLEGKPQWNGLYSGQAVDKIKQLFIDRETRQAIADTKRREKRHDILRKSEKRTAEVKAIPARSKKSQATIDADNGQHDEIGTAWIIACERYQTKNNVRWMRKSDYLEVFKSMGRDWLDNFLRQL